MPIATSSTSTSTAREQHEWRRGRGQSQGQHQRDQRRPQRRTPTGPAESSRRPGLAPALISLAAGLCLIAASLGPSWTKDTILAIPLAGILSCTAFLNAQGLFRACLTWRSRLGSILAGVGGLLILGVGALHAAAIWVAGGQLDGALITASSVVVPLAGLCCLAGGVLHIPRRAPQRVSSAARTTVLGERTTPSPAWARRSRDSRREW